MSRLSGDEVVQGRLMNGYDYTHQAWVKDGKYKDCQHPASMAAQCQQICYGKQHAGEPTA